MKLKTKIIAIASTAVIAVGAAFGVGFTLHKANAAEWENSVAEWTWEESYNYASTFSVPEYKVTVGGEEIVASSVVTYPNGATTTETEIVLDQAGIYTVSYYASKGGKEYSKKVNFTVEYQAYYIHDEKSSIEYGVYKGFGADTPDYAAYKHDGLIVRLAPGDSLDFTQILSVDSFTSQESIIEGFITPDAFDTADFDKLTLTLTDSLDSSIYLNIDINRWWNTTLGSGKACSFVMAGGNGQDMVGLESGKPLHVNDGVGTPLLISFMAAEYEKNGSIGAHWSGNLVQTSPSKYPLALSYDNATKMVYAKGTFVSDLDSAEYYSTLWNGFPSGKVRLSISCSSYLNATANFCLTKVMGMSSLDKNEFTDTEAPVITVDTAYETMPNAKVGVAYKVPTASAFDEYAGVREVRTQVWYNRASNTPTTVSLKDGTFTPDRAGYYSIVYTATDFVGNVSTAELPVYAAMEIPELVVENPADILSTATLGYEIAVSQPIISGGSGTPECKILVSGPEAEYEIKDKFVPDVEGTWRVTYLVTDYLGTQAACFYEIEATKGAKPIINDQLTLPQVFLAGVEYTLPELYANDYSSGRLNRVLCDVKVEYGADVKTYKAGDKFTPSVTANGDKLRFTYSCGETVLEAVEVPVIIIKEGNKVKVKNYIYGEGFEIKTEDANGKKLRGLQICATQVGSNTWTFANPQVADLVSMQLSSMKDLTKYKALQLTLTDIADSNEKATLNVAIGAGKVKLSNGSFDADVAIDLYEDTYFEMGYAGGRFKFENVYVNIDTYDNGEAFNGFSSNKVYVSVTMVDAKVGASYMLQEFSGSTISYREQDYGDPNFAILGDYGGSYSIGSTYVMAPAMAGDTFAPQTSLTVTVTDPLGNIVTALDGTKLENADASKTYTISLSAYGSYSIQYVAAEVDWFDGEKEFINYVTVIDEIAPVITVTSEYTKTVKVGENIIFPNFTVSDNLTEAGAITVDKLVQNPTGRTVRLSSTSNAIKATYEGTYYLSIIAKDAYGNITALRLEVVVTK